MKILFITLLDIRSIKEHNLYADLMRAFVRNDHDVYIVSPVERRYDMGTQLIHESEHVHILKLRTGNMQKTNSIEKGVSMLLLEYQLQWGIRKYLKNVRFDLVIYSTPPITLVKPIRFIRKRDGARTYLLLKDIFPQNAVDLGMMNHTGLRGVLYGFFRAKEKKLYALSDTVGCMSQANVNYLLEHNPEITAERVEICPNCIEIQDVSITPEQRIAIRERYGIPLDKKVFVYGGNLGRPQGIPFIIDCLQKLMDHPQAYFLLVGDGTEYAKLQNYLDEEKPNNVKLLKRLPRDEYDQMIAACDVGLIFLDHCFTIPNFPSRLLSYLQANLPVLAATDPNTDVGKVIVDGGFGWWCESNDVGKFCSLVEECCGSISLESFAQKGRNVLERDYNVDAAYELIAGR